jgi:hypothetical protein
VVNGGAEGQSQKQKQSEGLGKHNARNHHVTVRGLQRAQLLDNEEQEDHNRPLGVQQVLSAVPQAH